MTGRDQHRGQFTPVPGNSVVVRKNLLDDPGHRRGHGAVRDSGRPVGSNTLISRVGTYSPVAGSLDVHLYLSSRRRGMRRIG